MSEMATAETAGPAPELNALLGLARPSTDDFRRMFRLVTRIRADSPELAGQSLDRIRALAAKAGHQKALCVAHQMLAEACLDRGDYDGCIEHARRELETALACREPRYEASHYFLVGRVRESTGLLDAALTSYERAIEIYRRIGHRSGENHVQNQLGNLLALQGDAAGALERYQRCLAAADAPYKQAAFLHNIGMAQQRLGRWEEAFDSFYRALAVSERLERTAETLRNWAHVTDSLGELYLRRDRPAKAVDTLSRVVAASEKSEMLRTAILAEVLGHLGEARLRQGDAAGAERDYRAGLALADRLQDRCARAGLLRRLAELELNKGDGAAGHASVREALALSEEMKLGPELCEAWRVQALLHAADGMDAEARESFGRSVAALPGLEYSHEVARARLHYGRLLLRAGDTQTAESELRQAARTFRHLAIVSETEETNRLLLSPAMAADRGVALLLAVSELALLRLEPARFLKRALNLLCTAFGCESAAVVAGDQAVASAGGPDVAEAVRAARGGVTGQAAGPCWQVGNTPASVCLQRPTAPGSEPSRLVLEAVGNLLVPAVQRLLPLAGQPRPPELPDSLVYRGVAGSNPQVLAALETVARVAGANVSVLIRGESGTGKELVARALHESGPRAAGPFVAINCAAVPESLLEAEFFGVEKGAATGAVQRTGRFEQADGGTVFLDEIGDMSLSLQAKLLRFLQERTFERIGGGQSIAVDIRVVAATNRDVDEMVRSGRFRGDLYYRVNTVELLLPPLRERPEDIPLLVRHFIDGCNQEFGRTVRDIEPATLARLRDYTWPGNVRELQHVIERAVIVSRSSTITVDDLAPAVTCTDGRARRAQRGRAADDAGAAVERDALLACLEKTGGNVKQAAAAAGYSRAQFYRLLGKYGISRRSRP
ncbi:tetratricopeptide repeat protein [candidate division WOR-3 bacterium]|nr:tetratricopeptide repeat protein [candidate division WOR-3 bacterium]